MRADKNHWLFLAGPVVALITGFGHTWDPFSVIKLFALAGFAGLALVQIYQERGSGGTQFKSANAKALAIFVLGLFVPLFFADSPVSQQLYGVAGRNLGLLYYLFLATICLGASLIASDLNIEKFLKALVVVATIESFLGLSQKFNLNVLPIANPKRDIIGTFGNTNYISSFLAFSVIILIFGLSRYHELKYRIGIFVLAIFQIYVVVISGATQGVVIIFFGLIGFINITIYKKSKLLAGVFTTLSSSIGILGLCGVLQKGPLAIYLYQDSVTYRGDYWRAGISMFKHNWITGVGLDSYGDYYRFYRDELAAHRRTSGSYPNSAHNIVIDFASTGGLILSISYLVICALTAVSIVKNFRRNTEIDNIYCALVMVWAGYTLQAFISVNVSSLAVWGWLASGLILGYQVAPLSNSKKSNSALTRKKGSPANLVICLFGCLILITPLMLKDILLGKSSKSGIATEISDSVLRFPRDAEQIGAIAEVYRQIGQERDAYKMAKLAVEANSRTFRGWEIILKSPVATWSEKQIAVSKLKALDPAYASAVVNQ